MLMPIEGLYAEAYNNVVKIILQNRDYGPITARMMGVWWIEETGLKLVFDEMHSILCIDFDDYHDASLFLLKYS